MHRTALYIAAVLLGSLSATAAAQEEKSVSVVVGVPKDSARDILLAKLADAGLTPASVDGSTLSTVPEKISGALGVSGLVTYRALLVPASGGGTRIVLTAWLRNTGGEELAKAMSGVSPTPDEKQITSKWRAAGKKAWDRLDAIAAAIKAAAPAALAATDSTARDMRPPEQP